MAPINIQGRLIKRSERATKALSLRKAGKSYEEIGVELGVKAVRAFVIIKEELARLNKDRSSSAEEILRLEIERCYEIVKALWPRRNEPRTAEVILKTIERISRFYGLDKPLKIEQAIQVEDMTYEQLIAESKRIGLHTPAVNEFEVGQSLPGLNIENLNFLPDYNKLDKQNEELLDVE